LINKLLHGPSETLRQAVAEDPALARQIEDMIRRLFVGPPAGGREATEEQEKP